MEVKDNSSVIRVPLADPSCNKDGLLKFALPRECVSAEPDFYATTDTVVVTTPVDDASTSPSVASAPPPPTAPAPARLLLSPAPAEADVATLLDLALDGVRAARRDLSSVSDNLAYADFTVRRTQGDFQRLNLPLNAAAADNAGRDVHEAGQQLDFILWSARNGLHDSQQGAVKSSSDAHSATADLVDARHQLEQARKSIDSSDPRVMKCLADAEAALDEASQGAAGMMTSLNNGAVSLRESDSGLLFADQYINEIKNDRPGVDVSNAARQLRGAVDVVKGGLDVMDHALGSVRDRVQSADGAAERAEKELETARRLLSRGDQ